MLFLVSYLKQYISRLSHYVWCVCVFAYKFLAQSRGFLCMAKIVFLIHCVTFTGTDDLCSQFFVQHLISRCTNFKFRINVFFRKCSLPEILTSIIPQPRVRDWKVLSNFLSEIPKPLKWLPFLAFFLFCFKFINVKVCLIIRTFHRFFPDFIGIT